MSLDPILTPEKSSLDQRILCGRRELTDPGYLVIPLKPVPKDG